MKFNNLAPRHYEMVHYTFCALARWLQTGIFIAQNAKKPAEWRALSLCTVLLGLLLRVSGLLHN
jgi:hypothetical protein